MMTLDNFKELIQGFENLAEWADFCMKRNLNAYWNLYNVVEKDGFYMSAGASKACFVDSEENYVYKIGLSKEPNCENRDYCEIEYNNWLHINAENDFGDAPSYFVPVDFLGNYIIEVDGEKFSVPVFGQEMVDIDEERVYDTSFEIFSENEKEYEADSEVLLEKWSQFEIDEQVLMCFPDEVFALLNTYHINDIHDGNVGFLNEQIKIFDYSGYMCW